MLIDNTFDVVFARALLHHSANLDKSCSEFYRVLKPNGVICVIREHVISSKSHLQAFLDLHPLHFLYGGENAYLLSEYKDAIISSGLKIRYVLSPFQSPINYSPYDRYALCREISSRIMGRNFIAYFFARFLNIQLFWFLFQPFFTLVDHRPGRLYSFIAFK